MNYSTIRSVLNSIKPRSSPEQIYYDRHYYRYIDTLARIPGDIIIDKTILDIGIIPGHLSICAANLGAKKIIGIDYDPERFGYGEILRKQDIALYQCDINYNPLPLNSASVDTVLFTEVIEHLISNPRLILNEINRVLKPGGSLIITTPNIKNLANRIKLFLGKPIYPKILSDNEKVYPYQQHQKEYYMEELTKLLLDSGFIIRSKDYIAGTEKALVAKLIKVNLPYFFGSIYAFCAMAIPFFRSYLFMHATTSDTRI